MMQRIANKGERRKTRDLHSTRHSCTLIPFAEIATRHGEKSPPGPACLTMLGNPVRVNATGTRDTPATFRKDENSVVFNIGHSWRPRLRHVYGERGGVEICGIIY